MRNTDIFLIDDTLKNNIVLGNKKFDEFTFNEVIKASDLINTINGMEKKENTFSIHLVLVQFLFFSIFIIADSAS